MTHHFLYWLGIGGWCLGLTCAPLLGTSKTYPLLMRLPWSRGSSVHFAAHPWPIMAWTAFWFLIPHNLLFSRAGSCPVVGFPFLSPLFALFVILLLLSTIPFCCSYRGVIWPVPVGPLWVCCLFFSQWPNMVIDFILVLLWTFLDPFDCLWALLSHFLLFEYP